MTCYLIKTYSLMSAAGYLGPQVDVIASPLMMKNEIDVHSRRIGPQSWSQSILLCHVLSNPRIFQSLLRIVLLGSHEKSLYPLIRTWITDDIGQKEPVILIRRFLSSQNLVSSETDSIHFIIYFKIFWMNMKNIAEIEKPKWKFDRIKQNIWYCNYSQYYHI